MEYDDDKIFERIVFHFFGIFLQAIAHQFAIVKVSAESKLGGLEDELRRLRAQVEELNRQVHDLTGVKSRLSQENFELHRQVQDLDNNNGALARAKAVLQQQLDEAKNRLDEESRVSNAKDNVFSSIYNIYYYYYYIF